MRLLRHRIKHVDKYQTHFLVCEYKAHIKIIRTIFRIDSNMHCTGAHLLS